MDPKKQAGRMGTIGDAVYYRRKLLSFYTEEGQEQGIKFRLNDGTGSAEWFQATFEQAKPLLDALMKNNTKTLLKIGVLVDVDKEDP